MSVPVRPGRIMDEVRNRRDDMVSFLRRLVEAESPTDRPESQAAVQTSLADALRELGFEVRHVSGRRTGGHLYARPARRVRGRPAQLLMGHSDTVWPVGTLERMPCRVENGRLWGPGSFDMKAGLTQMVFALRALRSLDLEPAVTPVILVNSDEEVGSPESKPLVRMLARRVCRALVLEPSLGPEGKLKTARRGVGRFTVTATGRASHSGLDPEAGASAVLEMSHIVQALHGLTDREREVNVNVGVIEGGTRPNVVPERSRIDVDVRVLSADEGERVAGAIRALEDAERVVRGVRVEVDGGMEAPPMEPTPRNRRLWETARRLGAELGLELRETVSGGASDGNTTSEFTATLDGLGPVGDGAHAEHEHVVIEPTVERCALLARLIMAPAEEGE